ncbi:MAG: hypothetical protein WD425_14215 [Nitrospirales bacterium]
MVKWVAVWPHPKNLSICIMWGKNNLLFFLSTVIGVLATDLLIGVAIGIFVNMVIHLKNGAPMRSLFKPQIQVVREDGRVVTVKVKDSAIFSTGIALKKTLERVASEPHVILDFIRHVFGGSHDDVQAP